MDITQLPTNEELEKMGVMGFVIEFMGKYEKKNKLFRNGVNKCTKLKETLKDS